MSLRINCEVGGWGRMDWISNRGKGNCEKMFADYHCRLRKGLFTVELFIPLPPPSTSPLLNPQTTFLLPAWERRTASAIRVPLPRLSLLGTAAPRRLRRLSPGQHTRTRSGRHHGRVPVMSPRKRRRGSVHRRERESGRRSACGQGRGRR